MKSLSLIIFAILSCVASLALGEPDVFYQDIDPTAAPPAPLPPAAMSVVGEMRSVDESRQPRLWGEGRPGTFRYGRIDVETDLCVNGAVEFGLTYFVVEWENTPTACPVGTWVCTKEEIGSTVCNTARPDSNYDGIHCDGSDFNFLSSDAHLGWVADSYPPAGYLSNGYVQDEAGGLATGSTCTSLPVWCCSEYQP